jgi:chromate reductase
VTATEPVSPTAATGSTDRTHTAVAISGSLRADSSNTGLVRMAERLAPTGLTVQYFDVGTLPFYNADLETDPPATVVEWREAVGAAAAVLIGLPEYNFLPSPTALNAIAWISRPYGKHTLSGKVVALVTSGGRGGGSKAQAALAPVLGLLGNTVVDEPPVLISLGAERISADGTTTDPDIEAAVSAKLGAVLTALSVG